MGQENFVFLANSRICCCSWGTSLQESLCYYPNFNFRLDGSGCCFNSPCFVLNANKQTNSHLILMKTLKWIKLESRKDPKILFFRLFCLVC